MYLELLKKQMKDFNKSLEDDELEYRIDKVKNGEKTITRIIIESRLLGMIRAKTRKDHCSSEEMSKLLLEDLDLKEDYKLVKESIIVYKT